VNAALVRAKHRQAAELMAEQGLDCWMVQFGRETGVRPDPTDYLVGIAVTWPSAFLLDREGRGVAVVATGDQAIAEATRIWDEVRPYVQSPRQELVRTLDEWAPRRIGVTWDAGDNMADGITHGMLLYLQSLLEGTAHHDRLVGAGELAAAVRRRKLPEEIEGIRRAVEVTEAVLERIERELLKPGAVERDVMAAVQGWVREAGHAFAWDVSGDPLVNFGAPEGPVGHTPPGAARLEPGLLAHVDIGLVVDGFASDLQRMWYLPRPGETAPPEAALRAFDAVTAAIDTAVETLAPGVRGHEVDAAARALLTGRGYWDPPFAFGHHVGQVAHDGGGVLGPRWERYGALPDVAVEAANVFAVETGVVVEGLGLVGLEEQVLVDENGARYLSHPQRALKMLAP
jgi:Xaa-Pro aminopeptidase